MSANGVDGLNAGYAQLLLDEYLENPEAVPPEWRALFESGDPQLVAARPGLARLVEALRDAHGDGNGAALPVPVAPRPRPRRGSPRGGGRGPHGSPRRTYSRDAARARTRAAR